MCFELDGVVLVDSHRAVTHILEVELGLVSLVKLNSKRQKRRPLPVVSARLVPTPLRYSGPVIRF